MNVYIKSTLIIALFLGVGFRSVRLRTERDVKKAALFAEDRARLLTAFSAIERGKTTLADLVTSGIEPDARNVIRIGGIKAFRELMGAEAFRNIDPTRLSDHLEEFDKYEMLIIPFKSMVTVSDRIYFSKKDTHIEGWDVNLYIVLKDDLVLYSASESIFKDETMVDKAFMQGVINFVSEIASPLSKGATFIP